MSAMAYVTKRGKTKKAKLGKRMDANNNKANKLTQKVKQTTTKQSQTVVQPAADYSDKWNSLKLKGDEQETKLALSAKCQFAGCQLGKIESSALKMCGQCQCVAYCSRECQVGDWPIHKLKCKDLAEKRLLQENQVLKSINDQLQEISIKSNEQPTNVTTNNPWLEGDDSDVKEITPPNQNNIKKINTTTTKTTDSTTTDSTTKKEQVDWKLFQDAAHAEELSFEEDDDDDEEDDD